MYTHSHGADTGTVPYVPVSDLWRQNRVSCFEPEASSADNKEIEHQPPVSDPRSF